MSEEKVKELQEFVDDFHKKIKEAYTKFEIKQNKIKTLKKSHSQVENTNKENKFPTINNNKYMGKISLKKNLSNNNLTIKTPIWKPPNSYPNYFEEFKRLQYKHEISDWEKVCNIFILKYFILFNIQERISLCKRSYEKEIDLPQKSNFVCRRLIGHNINKYPNIKKDIYTSILGLGKDGKKIISKYIKDNDEKEKKIKEKEDYIYKYFHSKPPVEYNSWKFSNHIIKEFCKTPVDNVHSFAHPMEPKPKYMVKPFRRPKENGDYFEQLKY